MSYQFNGPEPYGMPPQPPKKKRHRVRNTLLTALGVLVLLMVVSIIAGASSGSSPQASAGPSAQPSPSAAPSSAQADSGQCTSRTCIAQELDRSIPGDIARDGSVMGKTTCAVHTVKNDGGGNYTASCDVTYSDGEVWSGYGTVLTGQDKVSFEPEEQVGGN
jgi:hypothetical protein